MSPTMRRHPTKAQRERRRLARERWARRRAQHGPSRYELAAALERDGWRPSDCSGSVPEGARTTIGPSYGGGRDRKWWRPGLGSHARAAAWAWLCRDACRHAAEWLERAEQAQHAKARLGREACSARFEDRATTCAALAHQCSPGRRHDLAAREAIEQLAALQAAYWQREYGWREP